MKNSYIKYGKSSVDLYQMRFYWKTLFWCLADAFLHRKQYFVSIAQDANLWGYYGVRAIRVRPHGKFLEHIKNKQIKS